jgi:prevent-host-death family protein
MKTLPVGELKAQFSEVLERVKKGESFGILYGKKKTPVAMIVPYSDEKSRKDREIGYLEGKVTVRFSADFRMSEEELLGIQ